MSSLFVSLRSAAESMRVFERGLSVVQNNVANASTPGFARQRLDLYALPFDTTIGLSGGVGTGGTIDARNEYAERAVRRQMEESGTASERLLHLEQIELVFDVGSGSGIAGAVDRLFQAFSALTVAPNDIAARQVALDRAREAASAFNGTASALRECMARVDDSTQNSAREFNRLAAEVRDINLSFQKDYRAQFDPGLSARLNNVLEQMSECAGITALRADNGTVSVYLGGQSPVVLGEHLYPIAADTSGVPAALLHFDGQDITAQVRGGKLQADLDLRNATMPALEAELNRLAASLADEVNATLTNGVAMDGLTAGAPLFQYDVAAGAARTLTTTQLTPRDLALATATSPGSNGVALELARLGQAKPIDGFTFSQFYGTVAASAGRQLETAREAQRTATQLCSQSRQLREDLQRVNLDEEAIYLTEFQRAYQASAQLIRALDEMTEIALNMLR